MSGSARADELGKLLAGRHLPALDGLRAIAVTAVLIQHFDDHLHFPGDLGVSFFFVLSGFLVTWLLRSEQRASGTISLPGFYLRRTLRIFPAYYTFLVLAWFNAAYRLGAWPAELSLSALSYTFNYYVARGHESLGIGHVWSLAVEEQFYLLWPVLLLFLARGGRRRVLHGLACIIAGVLVWRTFLIVSGVASTGYVTAAFDTRFDNLAIGCLLAVAMETERGRLLAAATSRYAWAPLLILIALVLSRTSISDTYHFTAGLTLDGVLMAVLLAQLLQLHGSPVWSWLDRRPMRLLGRLSYSAYLFSFLGPHAAQRLLFVPYVARPAVGIALSFTMAALMYFTVERPFLALRAPLARRFLRAAAQAEIPATR